MHSACHVKIAGDRNIDLAQELRRSIHIWLSHRAGDEAVENTIAREAAARSTD
jgi:hypothetical protein